MMFSIISRVVFLPISVQSWPAWKSKWTPRKLSARLSRFGLAAPEAALLNAALIRFDLVYLGSPAREPMGPSCGFQFGPMSSVTTPPLAVTALTQPAHCSCL